MGTYGWHVCGILGVAFVTFGCVLIATGNWNGVLAVASGFMVTWLADLNISEG